MFNKLTELDKNRILNYITEYVGTPQIPLEELLTPWAEAKSLYLQSIFGNELIIKKDICFKESYNDTLQRYDSIVLWEPRCRRFVKALNQIYDKYDINNGYYPYWILKYATESCALVRNKITNGFHNSTQSYEMPLANGKTYRASIGMKPMKLITKIAQSYNVGTSTDTEDGVSDLEYFRRKHSLIFNNKEIKGELCLSIHPLDYMTMSDNDNGWDTCMSWMNDGEYKQGTVEMMNSPCVIVAYLTSAEPFDFVYPEHNDGTKWNSKKWRCLFIVDKDFIMSIKQYPYHNDNIVAAAALEIAKLQGWKNARVSDYKYNYNSASDPTILPTKQKAYFHFTSGAMYNDFGADNHHVVINPDLKECIHHSYFYSGVPECMSCGTTNEECVGMNTGAHFLECVECNPRHYCDECGCVITCEDEGYMTEDDYYLCECCWDEYTTTSEVTDNSYYKHIDHLYLSRNNTQPIFYEDNSIFFSNQYDINNRLWKYYFKCKEPHKREDCDDRYYITPEECTEAGLALFGIHDEVELKSYMDLTKDF